MSKRAHASLPMISLAKTRIDQFNLFTAMEVSVTKPDAGKYLALTGQMHASKCLGRDGIIEWLEIPSVALHESSNEQILENPKVATEYGGEINPDLYIGISKPVPVENDLFG